MSIAINIVLLIIVGIIIYFSYSKKSKEEIENHSNPIETEKEFEKNMKILEKFKKKAFLPITVENKNTFSEKSKIGGFPYLRNENDWPKCPNCEKNMQLFLQLNLQQLPEKKEQGLIQLFYCTTNEPLCESDLEAFFPFSKSVECRKIETNGISASIEPLVDEIFNEKLITGWTSKDDYPHPEEYEKLGIEIDLEDNVYELMEEKGVGLPIENDKLYGWPYWIQSVEYPFDRKTEKQMELLFQFDSEDNLPYMFGDSGIGHLTQSPDNDEELGFGWACC
ncbi:uncharacterized protein YwqG [Polaribacter sp. Hel1_33_96]|jgi:hypothetical protein|uniref:DUF1963 domain-containing protein n=1 Tax=Polaribacter sp. Hel1_33_96 TaxID=1336805 RepID=UPI000C70FE2E|nr:DUF1963 domain-containing protein [Polaribacter sp. Hel1_33_96]PKV64474.1 uncharacterized protein YwqG [Polaribacter sp. Hel1_33_96]